MRGMVITITNIYSSHTAGRQIVLEYVNKVYPSVDHDHDFKYSIAKLGNRRNLRNN